RRHVKAFAGKRISAENVNELFRNHMLEYCGHWEPLFLVRSFKWVQGFFFNVFLAIWFLP
ncbi:hypothetical protein AL037_12650, partial [Salipiger aestuarii]